MKPQTAAPALGAKAIPADNPTIDDLPLKQIHTGDDSDPAFHTLTISEAITAGKPSVIAFATPSFCESRTCGPSLKVAIITEEEFGDAVNYVHVEPYELDANGRLAGNQFTLVDSAIRWGLPTEPWVFVVDSSGTVVARFEGAYALEELEAVLTKLT